ncbi:MAG TPA: hypothetical protein PLI09_05640 [Candidatus Hydrogenedentes bacterium]|nr:hypothetical protein [Candidatus Hydrogenedentota bacterium]
MDSHSTTGGTSADAGEPGAPLVRNIRCRKCCRHIDTTYAFCPHCGTKQKSGDAWYYHPVWIAVLAFVLIGPFALPLVWKSTRMGVTLKLILAVLILAYTGYGVYYLYKIATIDLAQFRELEKLLH